MAARKPLRYSKEGTGAPAKQRTEDRTGVLRERAMLVAFSVGRWYGTGADEQVAHDLREKHSATGDIGTFTKRFMSRDRLAAINQVTNEARKYHKKLSLPWGDSGSRLLSADLFFEYKKEMTAYEMRFNAAVEEFLANFPKFVKAEQVRLNGLFKESDYPTVEALRERFRFVLAIEPLPSAEDFRVDLGEEELKRIRAEIEERVAQMVRESSTEIWERLRELIEKLKDRLTDPDASIRGSLFENLKELVLVLPKLNVTDDPKLKAFGDQVAKELLHEDLEAVKDDPLVRNQVGKKADKILDLMKTYTGGAEKGKSK